jgi:7-carboxy-7-deazaguanine synthase
MDTLMNHKDINKISLNINEIFYSIQGEGTQAGLACIFVRLQGCELRCSWCDTPYALEIKSEQMRMNGKEIADKIMEYNCRLILFTGGEPLNQPDVLPLMNYFLENNYSVTLETNGHKDISNVNPDVKRILDLKCPGSNMSDYNNYDNFKFLTKFDEVKCVIANREDYLFAKSIIEKYSLDEKAGSVILSPAFGKIELIEIAEWMLQDSLPARLQMQLHKFIWSPDTRGV